MCSHTPATLLFMLLETRFFAVVLQFEIHWVYEFPITVG
ncbi:hypothetical protein XNC1_2172 [Xenorhabdus nematophila ATCC 19061]|uniref:Uncharacterized protein n=1 Tax=Xenorhabdus nematophila (strain ATCC 19061 / DSM 3370 / CCUG 14189 / LMG 1036 / NCIMB 9965 / AN6) TaxID=406817 RepID=D3VEW9_XENNA|nr:hypothetical protein XNC1_2172 [Xenorhabdus nematophila ATCC 19061]